MVLPLYTLLPAFLTELGWPGQGVLYAQATSAYGAGVVVMTAVFMARRRRVRRPARVAAVTVFLIVVSVVVMSTVPRPEIVTGALGVLGALVAVLTAVAGGVWFEQTPGAVRVRVFSLRRLISFATIPLGTTVLGVGGTALGYIATLRLLVLIAVLVISVSLFALRGRLTD